MRRGGVKVEGCTEKPTQGNARRRTSTGPWPEAGNLALEARHPKSEAFIKGLNKKVPASGTLARNLPSLPICFWPSLATPIWGYYETPTDRLASRSSQVAGGTLLPELAGFFARACGVFPEPPEDDELAP